jgi:hypothetical protein
MTNGGIAYPQYTPTISIWRLTDNYQIVIQAVMTPLLQTGIFSYNFASSVYGIPYAYIISGDPSISPIEAYKYGTVYQEVPDRVICTVVADGSNTASTFHTSRTEATNNYWFNTLCSFLTGSLAGQVQWVNGYSGTTYFITVANAFTGAPSAGDTFELINF